MGLRGELVRLAPALTRPPEGGAGDAEATLGTLDLDHEGPPDGLSLLACIAAHRSYVIARGDAGGVSVGALALARLLVWAQRAAMLGPAPHIEWIGPASRCPAVSGRLVLRARSSVVMNDAARRAEAVALITPPPPPTSPESP